MRLLAALFTASTFASPVVAQEQDVANGSQIGNWLVLCEAVSVNNTACRVQQTLSIADSGQVVVNMMAVPRGEDGAWMVAQVPMGVYLPGGAVFRVQSDEETPQTDMVWQRCAGQVCEAAIELDGDTLAEFTANGGLIFGYRMSAQAEPIIVSLDVSDLASAVDAIRTAP